MVIKHVREDGLLSDSTIRPAEALQVLLQLHDKRVLSTRTLLEAFGLDYDAELAQMNKEYEGEEVEFNEDMQKMMKKMSEA